MHSTETTERKSEDQDTMTPPCVFDSARKRADLTAWPCTLLVTAGGGPLGASQTHHPTSGLSPAAPAGQTLGLWNGNQLPLPQASEVRDKRITFPYLVWEGSPISGLSCSTGKAAPASPRPTRLPRLGAASVQRHQCKCKQRETVEHLRSVQKWRRGLQALPLNAQRSLVLRGGLVAGRAARAPWARGAPPSPVLPGPAQLWHQVEINRNLYPLYLSVSGSMSEAPRHWSWATPPAHGAVDGGVTAGLCLATSHLHFQVRPLPSSRVVLQAERLRSPRRQQQVAQTIQTPSSAPAGSAPGCRCPPPPTATRNAVGKTTSIQGSQQFERAEFLCPL
ncbi:uncharacterized protein [Odocoileus virginianus]|uniref:Uncharacterized protein isoform X2 n=1 Tax=Odocoileus virginianus TaxID=9874 RepID=A0ABM4HDV5_ODOVR